MSKILIVSALLVTCLSGCGTEQASNTQTVIPSVSAPSSDEPRVGREGRAKFGAVHYASKANLEKSLNAIAAGGSALLLMDADLKSGAAHSLNRGTRLAVREITGMYLRAQPLEGDRKDVNGWMLTSAVTGSDLESPPEVQSAPKYARAIALTGMQENNEVLTVETNFETDDAVMLRVEGKEYAMDTHSGETYTFRKVNVPKIGINNAKLVVGGESVPFEITRTLTTLDEWRKYARPFDYKVVNKNPDARVGEHVKGRGRIYQIQESEADGEFISSGGLNVTAYGYVWDDNVRFVMRGTSDIVEGDIVNYFGTITGSYTYESEAGWTITTPMLRIDHMTK